jgi:hypothetical protein
MSDKKQAPSNPGNGGKAANDAQRANVTKTYKTSPAKTTKK